MAGKHNTTTSRGAGEKLPPLLARAVAAHQGGRPAEALPLYRQFLESQPKHPTALQLLGLLHSQRGEFASAISCMRESLRQFPTQPEVANNLGNVLSKAGRFEEAVASYIDAINLDEKYLDPVRNLGLCLLENNRLEDAAKSFRYCVDHDPRDAVAWMSLGIVNKEQEKYDDAIQCYRKAIAIRPDYAEAHHNLAVCLTLTGKSAEALDQFKVARGLGLDRAELHINLGNALVDELNIEGAIDAYRAVIERDPQHADSHRNLNILLWEQERLDEYLESYRSALKRFPGSIPLRLDYATALNRQELYEEAQSVLEAGLRLAPDAAELRSQLAFTLESQDRWKEALELHRAVATLPDAAGHQHISYARALLACKDPAQALPHAVRALELLPMNQLALGYLGLCWRMLGDERDAMLNDYDQYVRSYEVPVPAGYSNQKEFFDQLRMTLDPLHVGKRHPPDQTLRGGTQTHGELFDRRDPEITALVGSLRDCIEDYIGHLREDWGHPLNSRRTGGFDFSGSWSARLRSCGFHTMHVHPMGWLSSACYVQVPDEVTAPNAQGGSIKFGEPDIDIGSAGAAKKIIQPRVGQLVLFPSYMWHGTIPFESSDARTTVAFDVVPTPP